jgi:hypothetical protein
LNAKPVSQTFSGEGDCGADGFYSQHNSDGRIKKKGIIGRNQLDSQEISGINTPKENNLRALGVIQRSGLYQQVTDEHNDPELRLQLEKNRIMQGRKGGASKGGIQGHIVLPPPGMEGGP